MFLRNKGRVVAETEKGISVGRTDGHVFVRVVGRGTFLNSQPLRTFALKMIEHGCSGFVVDLSGCPGMDSTFVGVLAGIGLRLRRVGRGGKVELVNISTHNLEVLETMGLDQLFSVQKAGEAPDAAAIEFRQLPGTDLGDLARRLGRDELAEVMWEAHQSLVQVDERNAPRFQDVTGVLRERSQQRMEQHKPKGA
jgi:anti-anti-sigma regulatory factor